MVAIDFSKYLDSSELLTGSVTVTLLGKVTGYDDVGLPEYDASNTDLSFANKAVSSGALTILNKSVAAGKAAQFKVSGQQSGNTYGVQVAVGTDSTPARTKVVDALLETV